jgi:hypothetical protein
MNLRRRAGSPWLRSKTLAVGCAARCCCLVPRIALRLAESPVTGSGRLAGEGTIDQILGDLAQLSLLGADTVVLDPFNGDPGETQHPEVAWQALATVSAGTHHLGEQL